MGATRGQVASVFGTNWAAWGDDLGAEANCPANEPLPMRLTSRSSEVRKGTIDVNSPYTKHLDALDAQHTHSQALTVPTYAAAPMQMQQPAPVIIQGGDSSGGGGKAGIIIVAIMLAIIAAVGGVMIGRAGVPSWSELRRYEALSGREGEIRGRDAGWNQGRKQGRTEMQFMAQYEKLKTQATAFNQGYSQGKNIGQQMGSDLYRNRYRGYGYGTGRGYGYGGYGYGGRVGNSIASAQSIANMTGQPVDVTVG